jgi:biotin transport system substrate-specific component
MTPSSSNRTLVRICVFAALIAALGLLPRIDLPIAAGVPITAQTLGVMLAGLVLGPRAGAAAVLLFIFVVALGLPLLAGGRGGLAVFTSPTTGFLLGWIPGAYITGILWRDTASGSRVLRTFRAFGASVTGGVLTVYLCGILWLVAYAGMNTRAAALATAVFLPGDLIKAFIAAAAANSLRLYEPSPRRA